MSDLSRVQRIEQLLRETFDPLSLTIDDQSALHAGHPGAKGGGGHFKVAIVTKAFEGLSEIERHRAVYSALSSMMPSQIHALSIETGVPT